MTQCFYSLIVLSYLRTIIVSKSFLCKNFNFIEMDTKNSANLRQSSRTNLPRKYFFESPRILILISTVFYHHYYHHTLIICFLVGRPQRNCFLLQANTIQIPWVKGIKLVTNSSTLGRSMNTNNIILKCGIKMT